MRDTSNSTVYNSRIRSRMLTLSSRSLRVAGSLLIVFVLLDASPALANDWAAPGAQLASKIVAVTGPGAVALDITNRSSLSRPDFEEISRGLRNQLATLGLQFVNADQAAAVVQVSLSENLQNYVWVAEIRQGMSEPSVVMVSTPRHGAVPSGQEPAKLTIHKSMLWSQEDKILDVAVVDGFPTHMIVLSAEQVALYKLQNGHWQPEQVLPVTHARPWPRDLRGRLVLRKDHLFDAYLPSVFCRSTPTAPLTLNCYASDDPWPIGTDPLNLGAFFAQTRNYFTGALAPGIGKQTTAPAFYSAAPLPRDKYTLWVFAAVDGHVHLLDGVSDQTAGKLGWGSGIASVHSGCGSGWDVLATGSGNGTTDTLQAFEFLDREPVVASQPLEFSGRITSLSAESNATSAIAVARILETGEYEAFRLSLTCGQ
jgi:hypothetical protein